MDTVLFLHDSSDSLSALKFSVLYFDKVQIASFLTTYENFLFLEEHEKEIPQIVRYRYMLSCDKHLDTIEALEALNELDDYTFINYNNNEDFSKQIESFILEGKMLEKQIKERGGFNFGYHPALFNEMYKALDYGMNSIAPDKTSLAILKHYGTPFKLSESLTPSITLQKPIENNAHINRKSIDDYIESNVYNAFAYKISEILLPNLSSAELPDILELKYRMKDEMLELKNYITELSKKFQGGNLYCSETDFERAKNYVQKSSLNLSKKIQNVKISTIQTAMKETLALGSTIPLLISTFNLNAVAAISAAITGGVVYTGLQHKREINNISNDPLFFSIGLNEALK